jgi:phospholipid/cholesterol/gamma-HCH transport system substrate-binding protein
MKKKNLEFIVGVFLATGILCLAFLSFKIARKEFFNAGGYQVRAVFSNCSGLNHGASVMIAGVEIGQVEKVDLKDYEACAALVIRRGIVLQKDAIASIKTKGLIGEKYVEITPGASDEKIPPGGVIRDTEPALDIEGLISKFVQGNIAKPAN